MSSTPTKDSSKQRKLTDLRVIDLQRELRSFGVSFDKKDLKGTLVEKLKQALIQRKFDPDLYLFDTSAELKSTTSDEMNRNQEEFHLQENQHSEILINEIDADEHLSIEKPVQTMVTPSNNCSPSTAVLDQDESSDQHDRMENRLDLKQTGENLNDEDDDDDDRKYLSIDQNLNRKEDENNNEEMDHEFTDRLHSSSSSPAPVEDELHLNNSMDQFPETNTDFFHHPTRSPTNSTTDGDSRQPNTFEHHEQDDADDDQQTGTTSERTTDEMNAAKSDSRPPSPSSNDQQNNENKKKINKDQCHLWVSNIAKETHAAHLKDLFSKYGKVLTTKVISSSSSQWFGYITLATPDDVEKCIQALHQTELHGKKIHVDREMLEASAPSHSSSTSKSNNTNPSSSHRPTSSRHDSSSSSSVVHKSRSDYSQSKSSSSHYSSTQRDSSRDHFDSSRKRPVSSSSNDPRKKFSNNDSNRSSRNASSNNSGPTSRYHSSRPNERSESSRSTNNQRLNEKSNSTRRSRSNERRSMPSSTSTDRHGSTSIDKSRQSTSYKGKDHHSSTSSRSFHNDQRLRHDKGFFDRKHIQQHHEEEKLKEEQRRLAEERERVKRQQELLERERAEIERTRRALEKEKQEQARVLEKQHQQHRRLPPDDSKHRMVHQDGRHGRGSDRDSQRSYHSNTDNTSSNKGYNDRSSSISSNSSNTRGRNRPLEDNDRGYYPDAKRSYPSNDPRDTMYRDRATYPDADLPMSSSSMSPSGSNQRYLPSSSNPHRLNDSYNNLPPRGRDMDLPPSSSLSGAYQRSNRGGLSPPPPPPPPPPLPSNPNAISRRGHSQERYESQQYLSENDRRGRSPPPPPPPPPPLPPSNNKMRREPMESSHWERPKGGREGGHYGHDTHKYLPNQYSSDVSSQSSQQQGLWSSAPPSRQNLHHPDVPVKHPYGWQHQSPPGPPSSHDRSRPNIPNNQRVAMLPSNAPPPPPPSLSSSRTGSANQTHLYNHAGVSVNALSSSQQGHVSIAPPPPPTSSLHHSSGYLTQPVPPAGLVLHSSGQPRTYDPHYVVTQPLPHQRRY